jgi:hypothetical protein
MEYGEQKKNCHTSKKIVLRSTLPLCGAHQLRRRGESNEEKKGREERQDALFSHFSN